MSHFNNILLIVIFLKCAQGFPLALFHLPVSVKTEGRVEIIGNSLGLVVEFSSLGN